MKKAFLAAVTIITAAAISLNVTGLTKAADDGYSPMFNTFTNVSGIGDEKDFLRVQNDDGTRVNSKEVCSGETRLWIYVHNNRPSANNNDPNKPGEWDGIGVAKNTRVKLSLPGTYTNSTTATANISADNAIATATDTAFITCGGKKVKVEYVAVESVNSNPQGNYTLTGDIMSANGASLNYKGMTGVVPGCWEYRASIVVKVKITPEPEQPKPQTLTCTAVFNRNKLSVGVAVNGVPTNGAATTGYKIVWGDNTPDATTQTATHTFANYDTKYTIKAYVKGKVDGKDTDWITSDTCTYSFSEPKPTKPEPEIQVCELSTKKIITIKEAEFNSSKHSKNLADCAPKPEPGKITVCELTTKKIINIKETDFDSNKHTKDLAKCDVTPPPVTPPQPPTPEELPNTGAGSVIGLLSGVTMLGAVGHRMWTTRKLQ